MSSAFPALNALSRRVVEAELAVGAEGAGLALQIESVFARLQGVTATMVGDLGYLALQARAVRITRARYAWLPLVPVPMSPQLSADFPRTGWQPYVAQVGDEQAAACAVALFGNVLALLASFIGEDFPFRLVRRAWPDEGTAADRSGPGGT